MERIAQDGATEPGKAVAYNKRYRPGLNPVPKMRCNGREGLARGQGESAEPSLAKHAIPPLQPPAAAFTRPQLQTRAQGNDWAAIAFAAYPLIRVRARLMAE